MAHGPQGIANGGAAKELFCGALAREEVIAIGVKTTAALT